MSTLTQARRALAKSRRRAWRLVRARCGPTALRIWRERLSDEPPLRAALTMLQSLEALGVVEATRLRMEIGRRTARENRLIKNRLGRLRLYLDDGTPVGAVWMETR